MPATLLGTKKTPICEYQHRECSGRVVTYTNPWLCSLIRPSFPPPTPSRDPPGASSTTGTMIFTPITVPASTAVLLTDKQSIDTATTVPSRPPHIAESDCELRDCDDYPRFLNLPPCIQERAISSAFLHKASGGPRQSQVPWPRVADDVQAVPFRLCGDEYCSGPGCLSMMPRDLSSCLSSFCELDIESSDESDSAVSLPALSHGSSGSSCPYDADDTRSPGKQSTPHTSGSVPNNAPDASLAAPGPSQTRRGAKRARAPSDVLSSDHDSQPSRPRRQRTEDRPRVILACPFYKRDPARYRNCRRILLTKISYVKQHILRAHRMPPHCQRCNSSFHTDDQLHQHIRSMTCERRPYAPPAGVTEDQIFQLRSRVNQKNSLEDQWHEVFDIIFPGAPRPTSVYLDPELSQDLDEFVNFLTAHGPKIILERINLAAFVGDGASGSHSAPGLASGLSRALQEVYDRWYRSRTAEDASSSLPKPLLSGHVDHALPRPPVRSVSAMSVRGGSLSQHSLAQHETSFALGGSESYGELAPFRLPRASWETRVGVSPLTVSSNTAPARGQNSGGPEIESDPGRGRGDRGPPGSRIPSPPPPPHKG